tara:strand:- start:625 stop:1257 length:633 start_codon:yes stop_codon:yes gene_type:complete
MAIIKGLHAQLIKEQLKNALEKKGYVFFDGNKSYNLNIIGIRNDSHDSKTFDDILTVVYRNDDKEWEVLTYEITTDPGPSILRKPINPDGTAILVPNQYRGVYKIGLHGGSYRHTALIQRGGKVEVWRDTNKNEKIEVDENTLVQEGMFGINIHRHASSSEREYVRGSSAGCQVFKDSRQWNQFLNTCHKAADKFGNSFTYTLIDQKDLE